MYFNYHYEHWNILIEEKYPYFQFQMKLRKRIVEYFKCFYKKIHEKRLMMQKYFSGTFLWLIIIEIVKTNFEMKFFEEV